MPRGRVFTDEERARGMRKLLEKRGISAAMKRGIRKWLDTKKSEGKIR
jgi:hypothetical protein